jgi:hypothetical protein
MIPKNDRSKYLQQQLDEKQTRVSYNFIMQYKGLDSTIKLLLNEMCNDSYMNGSITWKHQTYADHIGITRKQVLRWFQRLTEIGILIANKNNKVGGKSNTFKLDVNPTLIKKLIDYKPVPSESQTCTTEGTEPVPPKDQTCTIEGTYNKLNKSNKDLLRVEEAFGASSPNPNNPKDVDEFIKTLKYEN